MRKKFVLTVKRVWWLKVQESEVFTISTEAEVGKKDDGRRESSRGDP